jgi:hypothetical protein
MLSLSVYGLPRNNMNIAFQGLEGDTCEIHRMWDRHQLVNQEGNGIRMERSMRKKAFVNPPNFSQPILEYGLTVMIIDLNKGINKLKIKVVKV